MSPKMLLSFVLLLPAIVAAANDWNTPCLSGSCSYDVHNTTSPHGTSGGSLVINGSTSAISDLTPAAGWTILDCDANSTIQSIRAICTGDNTTCSHLYQNGAVGTIVRLPENCGKMPFARIASEWNHENQTVPDNVAQNLTRRDGEAPTVRGISLDTNFSKVDPSHHGQVSLFLQGATNAAANTTATAPPTSRDLEGRSFLSSIGSAIGHALQTIEQTFSDNKSGSTSLNVDKSFTLFQKSETCAASKSASSFTAGVTVGVEAKATADLNYGLAVSGTIVPPKISEFGLVAGFDATLDGKLSLDAIATLTLSTGSIQIFQAGLPGLDFPGILTIGPSFAVNAEATAQLQADASLSMDLAYSASGARLYFPPNSGSSSGTFGPSNTNLQLSANPSIVSSGNIQAHLIPTISFGINALDGLADVDVNLNLDTSAELSLTLSKSASTAFSGCADVSTGLTVSAGATGSFFDLFSKSTTVTLYQKTFDLWKKCFGANSRRHAREIPQLLKRSGISCSGVGGGSRETMTSSTVPANSL